MILQNSCFSNIYHYYLSIWKLAIAIPSLPESYHFVHLIRPETHLQVCILLYVQLYPWTSALVSLPPPCLGSAPHCRVSALLAVAAAISHLLHRHPSCVAAGSASWLCSPHPVSGLYLQPAAALRTCSCCPLHFQELFCSSEDQTWWTDVQDKWAASWCCTANTSTCRRLRGISLCSSASRPSISIDEFSASDIHGVVCKWGLIAV